MGRNKLPPQTAYGGVRSGRRVAFPGFILSTTGFPVRCQRDMIGQLQQSRQEHVCASGCGQ